MVLNLHPSSRPGRRASHKANDILRRKLNTQGRPKCAEAERTQVLVEVAKPGRRGKRLDSRRLGKAPVDTPRRSMGDLLGRAVRFGIANDVLAAGEGIETMLSLRCALPAMPMAAALSANHLAALLLPLTLRRLYIARDDDPAGDMALAALTVRAEAAGVEALALSPRLGDFNEDLRAFGVEELRAVLRVQLATQDVARFMIPFMAGRVESRSLR